MKKKKIKPDLGTMIFLESKTPALGLRFITGYINLGGNHTWFPGAWVANIPQEDGTVNKFWMSMALQVLREWKTGDPMP